MADFKTHMIGAAAVSGITATHLMLAGMVNSQELMGYFVLGVIGGLLPDIDSDTSIPLRMAFSVLAVISGFLIVLKFGPRYSLIELILLWTLAFVGLRYCVFNLFLRLTVHRGLIHSIPAGAAFGLATTLLTHRVFGGTPLQAWMGGAFVFMGFLVHLLLDEIYSVDLRGVKLKRSFGSAFNLGSWTNLWGTLALYLGIIGLLSLTPPADAFIQNLLVVIDYRELSSQFLPVKGWFNGL